MKTIGLSFAFLVISFTVFGQTCNNLPVSYSSYSEAISKVRNATFKIIDKVDCSQSSWVSRATFHSCDGETGFFILITKDGKEYIHQDVPITVWKQFKNSSSFGTYFNENIKGKYKLKIG